VDVSDARRPSPAAPALMIAGAALILVGCVLPWFRLNADFSSVGGGARSVTANGMDTSDGTIFLVVAIGIGILGVIALIAQAGGARVAASVIAALGALFVGGIAIYDAVTPKAQAIEEASKELGGLGAAAVRRFIEGLFDRGVITIDVQLGLWVVIVGAVLALIGSLLAAATARSVQVGVPAFPAAASTPPSGSAMSTATPSGTPIAPEPAEPAEPRPEEPTPPMTPTQPPEPPAGPISEDVDRPSND
jgi:hypothetical protein